MSDTFALRDAYINKNFQISSELFVRDNIKGTVKYCSFIIYKWVQNKFSSLDLDEKLHSISRKRFDQKVDIIYNLNDAYFCLNAEHADKQVAGRIWSIEAEIICVKGKLLFGVRLSYTTPTGVEVPEPEFTIPRFVNTISSKNGMWDVKRIQPKTIYVNSEEEVVKLYELIKNPDRCLPVILIAEKSEKSCIGANYLSGFLIDVDQLANRIGMISHVHAISKKYLKMWNDLFKDNFGILEGAIRTYNPQFNDNIDEPKRHPFTSVNRIMASSCIMDDGKELTAGEAYGYIFARKIINNSLRERIDWKSIGYKFYYFANRELLKDKEKGTNDLEELVNLYEIQVEEYDNLIKNQENELLTAWQESENLKKQLEDEKKTVFQLSRRIEVLKEQLLRKGEEEDIPIPKTYEEMESWINRYYSEKIVLHGRAKRSIKEAVFEDVELVYRCLMLLGNEYISLREGKISQDIFDQKCSDLGIEVTGAIANSRAGELGDTYFVDYHGRKEKLEKHIKNKKVSRDPKAVLRIYFFWDDEEGKVVIGSLPQHLPIRSS